MFCVWNWKWKKRRREEETGNYINLGWHKERRKNLQKKSSEEVFFARVTDYILSKKKNCMKRMFF